MTESTFRGFAFANLTTVEDDALDRCHSESGQDLLRAPELLALLTNASPQSLRAPGPEVQTLHGTARWKG